MKISQVPILDLPFDIVVEIVQNIDFNTRVGLRRTHSHLAHAERKARVRVDELALYRTGVDQLMLSIKIENTGRWLLWTSKAGRILKKESTKVDEERRNMNLLSRLSPFSSVPTPLGDMKKTFIQWLGKSSIGALKIDGLYLCDGALQQLAAHLSGKTTDRLSIVGSFSSTSDSPLLALLLSTPSLTSLHLYIHRTSPKATVMDRLVLLQATSQLASFCVNSRPIGDSRLSEDVTEVTNSLLIKMLSGKCYALQLLFFTPLLSAKGVDAAIEHILSRHLPRAGLVVFLRSVEVPLLLRLHTLYLDAAGTVSASDPSIDVEQSPHQLVITFNRRMMRLTVDYHPSTLSLTSYSEVSVECTMSCFLRTIFDM